MTKLKTTACSGVVYGIVQSILFSPYTAEIIVSPLDATAKAKLPARTDLGLKSIYSVSTIQRRHLANQIKTDVSHLLRDFKGVQQILTNM